jgi:hypothetical protein
MRAPIWRPAEDAALRRHYPDGTQEEVLAALPGRTWVAVTRRAHVLGVRRGRPWTPEEDAELRRMWPEHARRTMVRNLGRSWDGIRVRAALLDLKTDSDGTLTRWKGYLTIHRAAEVTCYSDRGFRRILRAYQAHFATIPPGERDALPSPTTVARGVTGRWSHQMVDEQAARDAVEWWLTLESISQAAARLGLPYTTLATLLRERAVKVEKFGRRPPSFWDAFMASVGKVKRYPTRRPRALTEVRAAA